MSVASSALPAQTLDLLDQLTAGIAVLDRDACFVHANPAFVELTGVARLRGRPLAALGVPTDALAALIERVRTDDGTLSLRGFGLDARDPPLRVDVAVSPWVDGGCLLELRPAGLDQTHLIGPLHARGAGGLGHVERQNQQGHTADPLAAQADEHRGGEGGDAQGGDRPAGDVDRQPGPAPGPDQDGQHRRPQDDVDHPATRYSAATAGPS